MLGNGRGARPLALVYRGPASVPGCPEAVTDLLRLSRWGFRTSYVGPRERHRLEPRTLAAAALYVQPGGGELKPAWRVMRRHEDAVVDFVRRGGRYLGFCLGAYLAGRTPGFGLLPGDVDQYVTSPGATHRSTRETVLPVRWGGQARALYFEDGPYVDLEPALGGAGATVLATYDNGLPAAVVAPCGLGTVGVVGPHPEATTDWFTDAGLRPPQPLGFDLGLDLVDAVMAA